MKKVAGSYGKTFHTWHSWHTGLQKQLPTGVRRVMMSFTVDGQGDAAMVATRDQRLDTDSAQCRIDRQGIQPPPDASQKGRAVQLPDPTGTRRGHGQAPVGSCR